MRQPTLTSVTVSLAAPLIACAGCRAAANGASPEDCAPVASELPAGSSVEDAGGEYHLRLVATSGAKAGSSVDGVLRLQPQARELRYRRPSGGAPDSSVVHPLYGSADLNLEAVDAVQVGSLSSTDSAAPGVLVIERHERLGQAPSAAIVLRLGSEANRQDRQRVDGGYTALHVRQVSPSGFSGTWGSGVMRERSGGYFCAVRKD